MLEDIRAAPEGAILILHACAHNPTGARSPSCLPVLARLQARKASHCGFYRACSDVCGCCVGAGVDPTPEQWRGILDAARARKALCFFDRWACGATDVLHRARGAARAHNCIASAPSPRPGQNPTAPPLPPHPLDPAAPTRALPRATSTATAPRSACLPTPGWSCCWRRWGRGGRGWAAPCGRGGLHA